MEEHCCGVAGCIKGKGKICAHVTAKSANCGGNHTANSPRCTSRHKADLEARQHNRQKRIRKNPGWGCKRSRKIRTEETPEPERESREESQPANIEMDLEGEEWTQYAEAETRSFLLMKIRITAKFSDVSSITKLWKGVWVYDFCTWVCARP